MLRLASWEPTRGRVPQLARSHAVTRDRLDNICALEGHTKKLLETNIARIRAALRIITHIHSSSTSHSLWNMRQSFLVWATPELLALSSPARSVHGAVFDQCAVRAGANEQRVVWFLRRCHCRCSGRTTAREQRGATRYFLSLAQNFPACLAFRMARILVSAAEDLLVRLLVQEVVGDRMGGSLPRPFQPACSASFHQNASANGGGWYWAQRSEKKKDGESDNKFLF